MSKRKDQRKVRLVDDGVQDAENTLKVINDLKQEFHSTEKKLRLSYKQLSSGNVERCSGRGVQPSWGDGDARSVPPSQFSILHSDRAEVPRAHWVDQEIPSRDFERCESADSAKTFTVPRSEASRRKTSNVNANEMPSTPTFKFVDAPMPEVPPTPVMVRQLLAKFPKDQTASWVSVETQSLEGFAKAPVGLGSSTHDVPPYDCPRTNGVASDASMAHPVNGSGPTRPTIIRKSMKFVDWDPVGEPHVPIQSARLDRWDEASKPVLKRKSMKFVEPPDVHQDAVEEKGEESTLHGSGGLGARQNVVQKKSVVDPATVLASYPGFCDVRDLDKKQRPKVHLDVIQSQRTKSDAPLRAATLNNKVPKAESEFAPRKKITITPSTWREERKKLNDKLQKEKGPANTEQPNENHDLETKSNDIAPTQTSPQPNSPATPKEEEIPKPVKRFKPRPQKVEVRETREKSPPKVRRYDVEETREFIERQKQLRLAKLAKEKENKQTLKETIAMKLKLLQEKQLLLVRANVEGRLAKKSSPGRPAGHRRSSTGAPTKATPPRRLGTSPLQPPAVGLPATSLHNNEDIDKIVQTFTDNLNGDQLSNEQYSLRTPRQRVVISHSPPEKLEKAKSAKPAVAAPQSRVETGRNSNDAQANADAHFVERNPNDAQANADAHFVERNSNIADEFYSELQKMDSNTEELKMVELSRQLASARNDLSQSLASKSEVRGESARRKGGSTVHQHRNITVVEAKTQQPQRTGGLTSVLEYDRKRKRNQAATKIQAAFRGYRVRKMPENSVNIGRKYEFFKDPDRSFDSDVSEGPLSEPGSRKDENEKLSNRFDFDFRHYQLQPQPNNFISAVKQKLKMHRNERNNCWARPPRQKVPNSQVKNVSGVVDKSNPKVPLIPANESPRSIPAPQKSTKSYTQDFDDTFASSIISMVNGSSSTHSKTSIIPSYVNDLKTGNSESINNLIIPNVGLVRKRDNEDSTPRSISEKMSVTASQVASSRRSSHSKKTSSRRSFDNSKAARKSPDIPSSENPSSAQEKLSSSGNERDDDSYPFDWQDGSNRVPLMSFPSDFSRQGMNLQNANANENQSHLYPPNALHLQFQAELNLLDSVEASRRQLLEVEKLRAVNLAQQGSSSLAHALKCAQQKHEDHLNAVERKVAFEEALQRERLELQKFFKDALKSQTLLRKSSSESSKITASAHSSNDASKSSVTEVLGSNKDSGDEHEITEHSSSINASLSEHIEDASSHTDDVSDLELSSLDITRKMKMHMPQLGTSVNAVSDLAAVDQAAQNGGAAMAKFSFHLLEQLVRDEELRAQHQMSLLKLQDKTLTEKTKAEMAWLEVKKRQLRGKGMENQMSAIKKKQRGLILKLQQDKEELTRLKETQRIASEERKIMLRSQQHALRMDLATQNTFHTDKPPTNGKELTPITLTHSKTPSEILSERRSRSNGEKSIDTTLVETDLQQSDIPEEISLKASQSDKTLSTPSTDQSTDTKVDVQYLEQQVLDGLKKLDRNKRFLNEQAKELQLRREAVEKSLAQRKRLADEEKKIQELEAQENALALSNNVVQKQIRSFRDTSTSPFQTIEKQDSKSTISEHIVNSEASVVQSEIHLDAKSSSSIPVTMVDKSTSASVATDNYVDESFESAVSSEVNSNATALNQETHSKSSLVKRSNSDRMPSPVLSIKASLSPLVTNKARRRCSSGSDDSIIYSQTETTSEQSDAEGRITALNDQLKRRMLEAERLRREQKRLNRERLSCKEQTLLKQIQEYDRIIARAKQDIELEHDNHQSVSIVRPKIKQPRVAEKKQASDAGHSSSSQNVPLDNGLRKVRVDVNETENESNKIPVRNVIAEALNVGEVIDSSASNSEKRKVEPEISDKSSNSVASISEHIDDISDSNISGTESRKSFSEDSSVETTIHSLVPSLKSDAQDRKEVVSKESAHEQTPQSNEDEESKVEVSNEAPEQKDVEDDALSAASSLEGTGNSADTSQGLLEDLDENSGSHTSEVIKIFLDEKVHPAATVVDENSIVLEVTGINDTGISEGPLEEEFLEKEQEIEHDSLDGPALLNETFIIERETVDVSAQLKALTVDRVTDSILRQLLVECTTPPQKRAKVLVELSPETQVHDLQSPPAVLSQETPEINEIDRRVDRRADMADELLDECLTDCTEHMMVLHKKRLRRNASPSNVRRRVHEIMAETAVSSHRSKKRPQDLMISTYDVLSGEEDTPPDTPAVLSSDNSFDNDYLDGQPKSSTDRERSKVDLGVALSPAGESGSADTDGFTQEWFDEDFGLGTTHTKREAAELRIQQLQIEQEIQQLQQAQEQIPYFYIREIPNKPPPPYTPPGQSPPRPGSRTSPESRRRQSRSVTASQEETASLAASATDYLYTAVMKGTDLDLFQPPDTYYESSTGDSQNTFKTFMFDLVKEIVKDAYDWEAKTWHPSWERPLPSNKRQKLKPRSKEMLQDMVQRKTLLYLGFVQKSGKENMIMSWNRKKRDFVDELLMQEAHEEEESWINYDEDETNLKNDITFAILQSLLGESVHVFRNIRERRLQNQSNWS